MIEWDVLQFRISIFNQKIIKNKNKKFIKLINYLSNKLSINF